MRSSIFFFATAALAAPILPAVDNLKVEVGEVVKSADGVVGGINLRDLKVPIVPVSSIVDKVTTVVDGIDAKEIIARDVVPSVPESAIVGEVGKVVEGIDAAIISRDDITDAVPAGEISRRLLDQVLPGLNLGAVVSLISEVLTGSLTLVSDIKSKLEGISGAVEQVNVDSAFKEVEGVLSLLLTKVQETATFAGTGLDLTSLNPTLATLSSQLETITGMVQGLVDNGAAGPIVDKVKGELATVTGLVAGLE